MSYLGLEQSLSSSGEISMNAQTQIEKAQSLGEIVTELANLMYEVDNQIYQLAADGMEGKAILDASEAYLEIRKEISAEIQKFAATAVILENSANTTDALNEEAASRASIR